MTKTLNPRRLSTTTGLDRDLRVCVCVWQGAGSDFPQGLCVLHQCQSALIRSLFVPSSWGLGLSWRAGARSNRVTMSSFGLFRQLLHGRGQVPQYMWGLAQGARTQPNCALLCFARQYQGDEAFSSSGRSGSDASLYIPPGDGTPATQRHLSLRTSCHF